MRYSSCMPEPLTSSVAVKVLAPLLGAAVKRSSASAWRYVNLADSRIPKRNTTADFTEWVAAELERVLPDEFDDGGHCKRYFNSPECVTLLEHAFAFKLSGRALLLEGPL